MKKMFILIVMIMSLHNLYAQKSSTNIVIPELEYRNCSDTISLLDTKWEIVYKDTIDDTVYYTMLIGWFIHAENNYPKDPFPVTMTGTIEELKDWYESEKPDKYGVIARHIDFHDHLLMEYTNTDSNIRFSIGYCDDPWTNVDPEWGKR